MCRRVVVHGDVQGVFFRDSCQQQAVAAGVAGWVCNRADGAVEAMFEGEPQAVQAMVDWCHNGPGRARVRRVDIFEADLANATGFRIR